MPLLPELTPDRPSVEPIDHPFFFRSEWQGWPIPWIPATPGLSPAWARPQLDFDPASVRTEELSGPTPPCGVSSKTHSLAGPGG